MEKQKAVKVYSAEERLAFVLDLAAIGKPRLTVVTSDPTGGRGPGKEAYIAEEGMPTIYASTIEAAIDKAIERKRLIEKHRKELEMVE